jgi:hypothetical protein
MINRHKYPFAMVEQKGLIEMMESDRPSFTIPGCKTLRNNCVQLFHKMKATKIEKLSQSSHIALTTGWVNFTK